MHRQHLPIWVSCAWMRVYAHLTSTHDCSLDTFFPPWIFKLEFYINIWEFCSSFKGVVCIRYKYIYVVTYTVRCSHKSKQTGKKYKDVVPWRTPAWVLGASGGWMALPSRGGSGQGRWLRSSHRHWFTPALLLIQKVKTWFFREKVSDRS